MGNLRRSWLVLSGIFLALFLAHPRTAGAQDHPDPDLDLICSGKPTKSALKVVGLSPKYTIYESGEIEVWEEKGHSFCFERVGAPCNPDRYHEEDPVIAGLIVRIDRYSARGVKVVACEPISAGRTYEFTKAVYGNGRDVRPGDILRVSIYGNIQNSDKARYNLRLKERGEAILSRIARNIALRAVWKETSALREILTKSLEWKVIESFHVKAQKKLDGEIARFCGSKENPLCRSLMKTKEIVDEIGIVGKDAIALKAAYMKLDENLGGKAQPDSKEICDDYARFNWLSKGDKRLLVQSMIADTRLGELHSVLYDVGAENVRIDPGTRPILLVRNVPHDVSTRFEIKRSSRSLEDPAVILARYFIKIVKAADQKQGLSIREEESVLKCPPDALVMDEELSPVALAGSRVFAVREELGSNVLVTRICAGEKCIEEGEKANVTNTVEFEPDPSWGFSILAGFGITMRHEEIPRLEKVGGRLGPDQVYEVQEGNLVGFVPSIDLLLGIRHKNVVLAVGPSFYASVDAFDQWKAGLGFRVPSFSRHIYLIFHGALTFDTVPTSVAVGDRILLPEGEKLDLDRKTVSRWGGGITLGLDVSVLGELNEALFGGEH